MLISVKGVTFEFHCLKTGINRKFDCSLTVEKNPTSGLIRI